MSQDLGPLAERVAAMEAAEAVAALKHFWQECCTELRQRHERGDAGLDIARTLTEAVDAVVKSTYGRAPAGGPQALVALGGYGRGEMAPYSDVDLLFLFRKESDKDADFISGVLNPLWDLGFTLGYSSRTTAESVKMLRDDLESATAMMDGRFLAGDKKLFDDFLRRLYKGLPRNTLPRIHRLRQSRSRNSGSVQLLEPNVKESPGGLREIHILEWALRAAGGPDLEPSWRRYCDARDMEDLAASRQFLWRVRHQLHFAVGRRHDVLEHELKPAVATALGYEGMGAELAAEAFMHDYYQHARRLFHLADMVFKQLMRKKAIGTRRILLEEGVVVAGEEIYLPDWERYFKADKLRFLRLFYLLLTRRLRLSEQAQRAVRSAVHLVDDELRQSPEARDLFLQILKRKYRKADVLRQMHDLGVLGAYLPEFGDLTCLVQYDIYHLYTVDEHTLVALENLEALGKGERQGTLRRVHDELTRHDLLWLATLLHDVGKSRRDDHIARGLEMAEELLSRLDLPAKDRRFVLFLVEYHQDMVIMSQRRDLDDYRMIAEFAGRFANLDWLHALYLLSYADLSAVATDAWGDWQGALLWEIYYKTREQIESGLKNMEARQHARALLNGHVKKVTGQWPAQRIAAFQQHVEQLPPRYLVTYDRDQVERHLDLVHGLQGHLFRVDFTQTEAFTELTICTPDRRQLLAKLCGVLAVNDVDILRADVHTRDDDIVLDIFQVKDIGGSPALPEHKKQRLLEQFESVISGKQKARQLFESYSTHWGHRRQQQAVARPPEVQIENQVSDRYTVIDTDVADSAGLLYQLTYALGELELDIHMAIIHTVADRAVDAFYVTDAKGQKILNYETLDQIHQHLTEKLNA